jgi:phosphoribosylformimino-5-aminoimidazole carboxamide ribotide isomerase
MTSQQFQVIPAVDLLGDTAVRLEQGDFGRVAAQAKPSELVRRFAAAGAAWIHVVDLDGARSGEIRPDLVGRLTADARPARVQASGGIRSLEDAERLLAAGASRVVVGTAAMADPRAPWRFAQALGERLVVAVDVRAGRVAVRGWTEETDLGPEEAVQRCAAAGVRRLLCTAIDRDGTLTGPDLELLRRVVERSELPVLAAGGIRSHDDLASVAATGCEGAIVGRGFLDGLLPLSAVASPGDASLR